MDVKVNNTNFGKYIHVPNKNINDTSEATDIEALNDGHNNKIYKKTTYGTTNTKNCKRYFKYSLIFSGVVTIILMVVFGINNVAVDYQNSNIEVVTPKVLTTERNNATLISPKQVFDMLNFDDPIGSSFEKKIATEEGQDVVITNKTVIINDGNESVIITN